MNVEENEEKKLKIQIEKMKNHLEKIVKSKEEKEFEIENLKLNLIDIESRNMTVNFFEDSKEKIHEFEIKVIVSILCIKKNININFFLNFL